MFHLISLHNENEEDTKRVKNKVPFSHFCRKCGTYKPVVSQHVCKETSKLKLYKETEVKLRRALKNN